MKLKIPIDYIERKDTEKGIKRWAIRSGENWFSCFEEPIALKLVENKDKICEVELEQNKGFTNIVNFYTTIETKKKETSFGYNDPYKYKSMCVAYAHQWLGCKLKAFAGVVKDPKELEIIAQKLENRIPEKAVWFYGLIHNFDKIGKKEIQE